MLIQRSDCRYACDLRHRSAVFAGGASQSRRIHGQMNDANPRTLVCSARARRRGQLGRGATSCRFSLIVRTWDDADEPTMLAGFTRVLRDAGCDSTAHQGPAGVAARTRVDSHRRLQRDEYVTAAMLDGFDRDLLMCSNSRLVTDRGVWVCPLLVEQPDAQLEQRWTRQGARTSLRHRLASRAGRYGRSAATSARASKVPTSRRRRRHGDAVSR